MHCQIKTQYLISIRADSYADSEQYVVACAFPREHYECQDIMYSFIAIAEELGHALNIRIKIVSCIIYCKSTVCQIYSVSCLWPTNGCIVYISSASVFVCDRDCCVTGVCVCA